MAKRIQPKAIDLHIADRLRKLLPGLTPEERQRLKANIEDDGLLIDPIAYWYVGKRNVVVDGMHRWEIVRGTDIPYRTQLMFFASYEEAELWILNHQLGRRNLLDPAAIRKIRGELYNRLKTPQGGDHVSQEAKGQIDPLLGVAAAKVARKAGVSASTVKRDGARVEALAGLTKPAQKAAEKASDKDIKALSRMSEADQNSVARAVRVGQSPTVGAAIRATGAKPEKAAKATKPDYGKCSNCAGTKWKVGEDGVVCSRCNQPHGEPAGHVDKDRQTTQRQKSQKTFEAGLRAIGDMNLLLPKPAACKEAIDLTKRVLKIIKSWR